VDDNRFSTSTLCHAPLHPITLAAGWGAVFVLGNPAYYGRFGFNAGDASGFTSPYAGLHFMVLALARGGLPMLRGRVEYAAAFAKLG